MVFENNWQVVRMPEATLFVFNDSTVVLEASQLLLYSLLQAFDLADTQTPSLATVQWKHQADQTQS